MDFTDQAAASTTAQLPTMRAQLVEWERQFVGCKAAARAAEASGADPVPFLKSAALLDAAHTKLLAEVRAIETKAGIRSADRTKVVASEPEEEAEARRAALAAVEPGAQDLLPAG